MGNQAVPQLKVHIDGLLQRKQQLEQEVRERRVEADLLSAQLGSLEEIFVQLEQLSVAAGFWEVFDDLPVALVISSASMTDLRANRAARELCGVAACAEGSMLRFQQELSQFFVSGSQERSCEQELEQNGQLLFVQVSFRRIMTQQGVTVVAVLQDSTRQRNVEKALRLSEERYRTLVENQSDLVVKIDLNGRIEFASPSFSRLLGVAEEELLGRRFSPLLDGERGADQLGLLLERCDQPEVCYEEYMTQTDQGCHWFGWSFKAVVEQDGPGGFICIGRDITAQKQAEQNIQQLAYYDHLTGLPNRTLLQDRLLHALSLARRSDSKVAVLFLDLDRFKVVNDSMGHQAGDELLKQVAQRLRESIRDVDTVARQGGDEFVIVLNGIEQARQAAKVAAKIVTALAHPFVINGQSMYTGASIGIAVYPEDGGDVATLLKHADMAMYLSKESGRGKFKFFSQDMNDRIRERSQMEVALRQAIEHDELFLQFQPQFNIRDRRLTSLEALVRWKHPEHGVLLPGRFIPLAEETGLAVPLGEWVLRNACRQAAGWQRPGRPAVPVSVNLSARQFRHPELLDAVARSLVFSDLPPTCLELEITEQTLLENTDEATATLQELKWQGVQLTIDDFGTGYSSLSLLRRFPINQLKIDHSFIKNLHHNREDADIAEAIISVGNSLKLQVVAEGVEQASQLQFLHERGCEEMQGNFFSCPLDAAELGQCGWFAARA